MGIHLKVACNTLAAILSLVSCRNSAQKTYVQHDIAGVAGHALSPQSTDPDSAFLRKRLFRFFETHKDQSVFDTTDNTYSAWWGTRSWTVRAGHLFSRRQTHAMILYGDELTTTLVIYIKRHDVWTEIYNNTREGATRAEPVFRDWNGDGTLDIGFPEEKSWSSATDLWLVDRKGDSVYYIKEFADLDNPEIEKETGLIKASMAHAGSGHYERYRFSDYQLKLADRWEVWYDGDDFKKCHVAYSTNGKDRKSIRTEAQKAYRFVSKGWREQVRRDFNN